MRKQRIRILQLLMMSMLVGSVYGQTQTVGLFLNDTANVYKGYTLFAPKQYHTTYLIDNEGRVVHQWSKSIYPPGQTVYLLENGHLFRSCMTTGSKLSSGGGEGGRIEEYDWDDNLVWQLDFATDNYMQHHDFKVLPNGNVIMLVIERKTLADCLAAGFDPSRYQDIATKGYMVPDYVAEVQPTRPVGGTVVWEWHTWDHLIQNFDATKLNYGTPAQHPELVDCDGDGRLLPSFWNHMNCIDYNATFDQIALSVRGNSEVWIIDHSTTTAESASHSGGKRGKGGDLLYRWGNPVCYGAGNATNERYYQQHDVEWIKAGNPGAGDLTCFNNGIGRTIGTYSTVDEFTPAVDANGNYSMVAGTAVGPTNFIWSYKGDTTYPMYAEDISGAERLPNGNTIICTGTVGEFREVTSAGQVVWRYVCPVQLTGVMTQGMTPNPDPAHVGEYLNSVFRVYKYPLDYAAFTGKTMTPGSFIELNSNTAVQTVNESLFQIYPNPFTTRIIPKNVNGDELYMLANELGQSLWVGKHIEQQDFSGLTKGLYFLTVNQDNSIQTIKLIKY